MRRPYFQLILSLLLIAILVSACNNAENETGADTISVSGFIEASTYQVTTNMGGMITDSPVTLGDHVSAGQIVVQLDETALRLARERAMAAITVSTAALRTLEEGSQNYEVIVAEAGLVESTSALSAAQASLSALVKQYDEVSAKPPNSDLHSAESAVAAAKAGVVLAQALLDQVLAGPSEEDITIAKSKLAEANAALDLIDLQISNLSLRAPVAGEVTLVISSVGEVAIPGTALMLISEDDALEFTAYVPEGQISRIKIDDLVILSVDAYPQENFKGTVVHIADQAHFTPTNVQTEEERVKLVFAVRIDVDSSGGKLKSGMPANALIVHNSAG